MAIEEKNLTPKGTVDLKALAYLFYDFACFEFFNCEHPVEKSVLSDVYDTLDSASQSVLCSLYREIRNEDYEGSRSFILDDFPF